MTYSPASLAYRLICAVSPPAPTEQIIRITCGIKSPLLDRKLQLEIDMVDKLYAPHLVISRAGFQCISKCLLGALVQGSSLSGE